MHLGVVCHTCREYVSWGRCECECECEPASEYQERRDSLERLYVAGWIAPHEYRKRMAAIDAAEDAEVLERAAEIEAAELCREAA